MHSTIIKSKILTKDINRRDFLILMTISPLLITSVEAGFPIVAFGIRWFARELFKKKSKDFFKKEIKDLTRKHKKQKNVHMVKALEVTGTVNEFLNPVSLLADQVWSIDSQNMSSILITNNTNEIQNTEDIYIELKDENSGRIDVQTRIEPIDVPPKSNLVLDMQFTDLTNEGIKRLRGTYSNGNIISESGRILVSNNTQYGKSVEELYKQYKVNNNIQRIY